MRLRGLLCVAALVVACSCAAWAGGVRIVDGDTLELAGGDRVRLLNIDAPEGGQSCTDGAGRVYDCGAAATNALRRIAGQGQVTCQGEGRDQYGRLLARCFVADRDIGRQMVSDGHAVAYRAFSDEYLDAELDAAKAGRGIWAGGFDLPWDFRKALWETPDKAAPDPDCPIKGNISGDGERIYHTPWSASYARTRIDPARGERWFCDEAEALNAGWRAPFGS